MTTCPVCTSVATSERYVIDAFVVVECDACRHVFVANPPDSATLDAAYGEAYYRADASNCGYADYLADTDYRIAGFGSRLEVIEKFASPGTLLDIGCAVGLFLVTARERGWQASGYERSAWASQYGRDHYGVDIQTGDICDANFSAATFDAITMWDVLEHIENPAATLSIAALALKPGGILSVSTVNAGSVSATLAGRSWRHLAPPHHLQYFNIGSLSRLFETHGFEILTYRASGLFINTSHIAGRYRPVIDALNQFVCHWRLRPVISKLDLLDEIDVIARRKK